MTTATRQVRPARVPWLLARLALVALAVPVFGHGCHLGDHDEDTEPAWAPWTGERPRAAAADGPTGNRPDPGG